MKLQRAALSAEERSRLTQPWHRYRPSSRRAISRITGGSVACSTLSGVP